MPASPSSDALTLLLRHRPRNGKLPAWAFSVSLRFELIELIGAQDLSSRRAYSHVHIASIQELLCVLQLTRPNWLFPLTKYCSRLGKRGDDQSYADLQRMASAKT
jgi:hypothetical protein